MSYSVHKSRTGSVWPLGMIVVPTPGTPVCLMSLIDSANTNAPATASGKTSSEYTPAVRGFGVQGYHMAAANNGVTANSGNLYLLRYAAGGAGNRSDPGALVKIIPPGGDWYFPPEGLGADLFSMYEFFLDADTASDAGLVVAYGGVNP